MDRRQLLGSIVGAGALLALPGNARVKAKEDCDECHGGGIVDFVGRPKTTLTREAGDLYDMPQTTFNFVQIPCPICQKVEAVGRS